MKDAFEEVAPGVVVYRHGWADGTCAIVFGDGSAAAIDGGGDPADGEAMAACLRSRGHEPTRLIYTHGHSDHVWRAGSLGRGEVIAHELTHGVTEKSSQLVYRDQSGALNESFSDIFGIIIKNWWEAPIRDDVDTWDWELGPGLGQDGPLRDLSDPTRTGKPDHMDAYDPDESWTDVKEVQQRHKAVTYMKYCATGTALDR